MSHGGGIFEAARRLGCDWREILDFSASINPLGPAPGVREALLDAFDQITHYPDAYSSTLANALAAEWQVEPDQILLGNGATDLIHFLARVWPVEPTLVTPVFSEFHRAYPNAALDVWPDEGLVIVTNPVNPTGAAASIPERRGWTLVDESFIEFSDLPTRMNEPGAIVLRSLTKFHALPGLRIGALVGPADLVRSWRMRREPWQVNCLAEAAALAAVRDKDFHRRTREFIHLERVRFAERLRSISGVHVHPTHANFFLADVNYDASRLCEFLFRHKILIRNCKGWPGVKGEAVRFAIRQPDENDRLIELWRSFPCD